MTERKAVTRTIARRYRGRDRAGKEVILDELCELTGWHRDHARKALREVMNVRIVRERKARPPIYGEDVIVVLRLCWAVMGPRASAWPRSWVSAFRSCGRSGS